MAIQALLDEVRGRMQAQYERRLHDASTLLGNVGFAIRAVREAKRRFARQLAPDFRLFDYLRADEYGLSRYIADLLDPKGKHGQGRTFLDAFLRRISRQNWAPDEDVVRVQLEKQTDSARRIDIVLDLGEGLIGIENKPWANDQDRQLEDYACYLQRVAGNKEWLLIFVSNRDPGVGSIPQKMLDELTSNNHYIRVTYHEIVDWLDACSGLSRALVVRVFIEELVKYVRIHVNGEPDMSEKKDVVGIIQSSPASVEAAFLIAGSMDNAKQTLLARFESDLRSGALDRGLCLGWNPIDMQGNRWSGFTVSCGNGATVGACFEFQYTGYNGLCWGATVLNQLALRDEQKERIGEIMNRTFGSGKRNGDWLWWTWASDSRLGSELQDWSANPIPWVGILDGSLAERVLDLSEEICKAIRDCPDLLAAGGAMQ